MHDGCSQCNCSEARIPESNDSNQTQIHTIHTIHASQRCAKAMNHSRQSHTASRCFQPSIGSFGQHRPHIDRNRTNALQFLL